MTTQKDGPAEPAAEADFASRVVDQAIPLMQSAMASEGLRLSSEADVDRMAELSVRAVLAMYGAVIAADLPERHGA